VEGKEGYNVWSKEKIRYLNSRIISDPYNPQLHILLANALIEEDRKHEAKKSLRSAIDLDSTFAEAYCNLAVVLHSQGYLNEARFNYEKAIALDSLLIEARAGLGTLLCRGKDLVQGLDYLGKVIESDPEHSGALYNMAVAYHKLEDYKRSIKHLESLMAFDPDFPGARASLARSYYSLGLVRLQAEQSDLAIKLLENAVFYEEDRTNMHFALGLAYLASEKILEAEAAFLIALETEPGYIPALHNLAIVYELLGRQADADKAYLKVSDLAPHMTTIEVIKHAKYDVQYLVE
jgi:tetratricopeptide (TPR) repeat protein